MHHCAALFPGHTKRPHIRLHFGHIFITLKTHIRSQSRVCPRNDRTALAHFFAFCCKEKSFSANSTRLNMFKATIYAYRSSCRNICMKNIVQACTRRGIVRKRNQFLKYEGIKCSYIFEAVQRSWSISRGRESRSEHIHPLFLEEKLRRLSADNDELV